MTSNTQEVACIFNKLDNLRLSFEQLSKTTTRRTAQKRRLPDDFIPGTYSVICGRGKQRSASPGNKYLRLLVNRHLSHYSKANTKAEKTAIVSFIINCVREAAPSGAFVKQEDNGDWWEVDDSFSREKIGCIFRDLLHTQYRSSTKAKQARKKAIESGNHHEDGNTSASNVFGKIVSTQFPNVVTSTTSISSPHHKRQMQQVGSSIQQGQGKQFSSYPRHHTARSHQKDIVSRPPMPLRSAALPKCGSSEYIGNKKNEANVLSLLEDALGVLDMDGVWCCDEEDLADDLSGIFDDGGDLLW